MNWYLAKLVFRIICGDGDHTPQFDEQLRLIEAANEDEALYKAIQLGTDEQDNFANNRQQMVQWKFINVPELYRMSGLIDGAEVYSAIKESDDGERYTEDINRKAAQLALKQTHKLLQII
ncbi:MAG: hypothetical protein JWN76_759 [Chitinophagaceae bacterium]|nr:hypothetical protein [Chitinophagaceae bacterium]